MPTTKCECGAEITYKTKPPKLCPACQRAKKKRGKKPPKSSRKELKVSHLMMEMFPDLEVIHNGYYSWLRSPKNQPMQLDIYVPALKLAIELVA